MTEQLASREEAAARIPKEQTFEWRLKPMPGRLLLAKTVGKSLAAMTDIFAGLHEGGTAVCVLDTSFDNEGAFIVKLAALPIDDEPLRSVGYYINQIIPVRRATVLERIGWIFGRRPKPSPNV